MVMVSSNASLPASQSLYIPGLAVLLLVVVLTSSAGPKLLSSSRSVSCLCQARGVTTWQNLFRACNESTEYCECSNQG